MAITLGQLFVALQNSNKLKNNVLDQKSCETLKYLKENNDEIKPLDFSTLKSELKGSLGVGNYEKFIEVYGLTPFLENCV